MLRQPLDRNLHHLAAQRVLVGIYISARQDLQAFRLAGQGCPGAATIGMAKSSPVALCSAIQAFAFGSGKI